MVRDGMCASRIRASLALFVLLAAACGGSSTGARTCRIDQDCGGGTCQGGVCQAGLLVLLTSPAGPVATNGVVHVAVELRGQGGSPAEVEILADDTTLAKVPTPFSFDWDTSPFAEGSYGLWARVTAGDREYRTAYRTTVAVDRTPPAGPTVLARTLTNESPVHLSGTTSEGAVAVTIFEGATALLQVSASDAGAWSAALDLAPGPHALTLAATDAAGNTTWEADRTALSIEVERQPLGIVSRKPGPGATNVWSRDPIVVTFNKPLDPQTVTASAMTLAGDDGFALALKAPELSSEGTTVTIAPTVLPRVPNTLTLTLTHAIADRAGNALPETSWSWRLPAWQEPADPVWDIPNLSSSFLGIDDSGSPTVGGTYDDYSPYVTALLRWSGSAFHAAEPFSSSIAASLKALTVDPNGSPAVAWGDYFNGTSRLLAAGWNGSAWIGADTALTSANYGPLSLRFEPGGDRRPVVAWYDGALHVARLVTSSWQPVGPTLATTTAPTAGSVMLTFDLSGAPRVSWLESRANGSYYDTYFVTYDYSASGGSWSGEERLVPAGLGLRASGSTFDGSVGVDPSGRLVIAWMDTSIGPANGLLHVSRYSQTSGWELLGLDPLNVDSGKSVCQLGCRSTALAMDAAGAPVVAWFEVVNDEYALQAKRWKDPDWESLPRDGATVNSSGTTWRPCGPRLAVSAGGIIAISWWDDQLGLKVRRYNR